MISRRWSLRSSQCFEKLRLRWSMGWSIKLQQKTSLDFAKKNLLETRGENTMLHSAAVKDDLRYHFIEIISVGSSLRSSFGYFHGHVLAIRYVAPFSRLIFIAHFSNAILCFVLVCVLYLKTFNLRFVVGVLISFSVFGFQKSESLSLVTILWSKTFFISPERTFFQQWFIIMPNYTYEL